MSDRELPERSAGAIARTVNCPRCGATTAYSAQNRWRPFCSARCRQIDLGHWAAEAYRIAQQPAADDASLADDPAGAGSGS